MLGPVPRPAWAWVGRGVAAAIPQDPEALKGATGGRGAKAAANSSGVSTE